MSEVLLFSLSLQYVKRKQLEIMTLDEAKDLSVIIVGNLVIEGLVKDCTDTNDETEFEFQDVILKSLCVKYNIPNDEL